MYTSSYTNHSYLLLSKGPSFLVFCPEESAVSVVNACNITHPEPDSLQLQQDCKVKVGRNIHSGKVAAIGKCYAIILCHLAYCAYFYVGRHKLWFVAIVLVGSEEEMKQLANDYETGNWSPFGETDGKVGEEEPGEADSKVGEEKPGETDGKVGEEKPGGAHGKDEELHTVTATKPPSRKILQKADKPKAKKATAKKASTKKGM